MDLPLTFIAVLSTAFISGLIIGWLIKKFTRGALYIIDLFILSLTFSFFIAPVINLSFAYRDTVTPYIKGREDFVSNIPQTYPYATINNINSHVDSKEAKITFDLTVKQNGEYTIISSMPCYDQVQPPTKKEKYGTPQTYPVELVANVPLRIDFLLASQTTPYYGCPTNTPWFEFTLAPRQNGGFGSDYLVIFSGFLDRIKSSGFDNKKSGYPYIYVPEFSLNGSISTVTN